MTPSPETPDSVLDDTYDLIEEVLRTGFVLAGLIEDLLDALPEDAYPGEVPAEVVLDMIAGSAHPAAAAMGADTVRQATALVGAMSDRVIEDLKTASKLARRHS